MRRRRFRRPKEVCPLKSSGLLRDTALLTATGIFSQILGFFYRIALSRLIGAETMGLFQLVMPVFSVLLSATSVGLTAAVSTLSAQKLALGDKAGAKALVERCVGWFLLLGGALGCLLALGSDPISVLILGDARTQLALILLVPCFLLTGVENLHKHFFYGIGSVRSPALVELCEQIIRTCAVLALLVRFLPQNPERTVGLILCGMILCEVFSALTLVVLFRRRLAGLPSPRDPGLGRGVLAVALPVGGSALLGNLLGSLGSILIPQRLMAGGMEAGEAMRRFGVLFGMTTPLLCLPTAFIGALGLVLLPNLSEQIALGRHRQARDTVARSLTTISLLLLPCLAFLTAVGPELAQLLFHEETAGDYMLPLAVGIFLNARQSVLSCALNGTGQQKQAALESLLSGLVQLGFTFFTLPHWGLGGYLAGYLTSSVLSLLLSHAFLRRTLPPWLPLLSDALPALLSSLLMGLCTHLLFHRLLDLGLSLPMGLLLCLPFALVLYLAALQAQGVSFSKKRR